MAIAEKNDRSRRARVTIDAWRQRRLLSRQVAVIGVVSAKIMGRRLDRDSSRADVEGRRQCAQPKADCRKRGDAGGACRYASKRVLKGDLRSMDGAFDPFVSRQRQQYGKRQRQQSNVHAATKVLVGEGEQRPMPKIKAVGSIARPREGAQREGSRDRAAVVG